MNISNTNQIRFKQGTPHYESFFVRANHPSRPLAFWIRYTLFNPSDKKARALSELWAVYFNGETGVHTVMKEEYPLQESIFNSNPFYVKVGKAILEGDKLNGSAGSIYWELSYSGNQSPLLLLPSTLYEGTFPAAKSLVSLPMACFNGTLTINNETVNVENWRGSQNHNWGSRHTDRYAWGQVAGFDNAPETFLEVATARVKLGPFMSPPITLIVLRHRGHEIQLNSLVRAIRAKGKFSYFHWDFASYKNGWSIEGTMHAGANDFAGLQYYNPPGGVKHCLNTKIASSDVQVTTPDGKVEMLSTKHKAAFEILTDKNDHGIKIRV